MEGRMGASLRKITLMAEPQLSSAVGHTAFVIAIASSLQEQDATVGQGNHILL